MSFLLHAVGIGDAYAATTPQSTQGGLMSVLPMLIAFVLIFYFLLIRPQSKRQKEHRKLIEGLKKGDEIVTNGGVMGRINKINDDFIALVVANNVEIMLQKSAIASALPKGTIKNV